MAVARRKSLVGRRKFLIMGGSLLVGACGAAGLNGNGVRHRLTVSAAASLQTVLAELKPLFLANFPDVELSLNFASSGALQQQITHGAPVDVFISASDRFIDALERESLLLPQSRRTVARNQVVLVSAPNISAIAGFEDLATEAIELVALGHPESVPAGQYAREVLTKLELYEEIASKLVFGRDVRQVLSYVETGNVDVGLVYATDARVSQRVRVLAEADSSWHSPITYPVGVIANTRHPELSRSFVDFLLESPAQQVFVGHGFQAPAQVF